MKKRTGKPVQMGRDLVKYWYLIWRIPIYTVRKRKDTNTMKKETVIRQNRCDREMNFLLFGCFFLFLSMQLLVGETQQLHRVNQVNMALFSVFVPGFVFRLGYCFGANRRLKEEGQVRVWMRSTALRYYIYFVVLALGQTLLCDGAPFGYSLTNILTGVMIPSASAVFFSMALMLLLVLVFYDRLCGLAIQPRKLAAAGVAFLLCSFLRQNGETYALLAAFTGSSVQAAVPVVPYFAFFLLGIWFEEKKPGFDWKIALSVLAVTVCSLLFYQTPLQNLCRLTISALPVYAVYVAAEGLYELTTRLRAVRFAVFTIEPFFWAYAIGLFFTTNLLAARGKELSLSGIAAVTVLLVVLIYLGICAFEVLRRCYTAGAKWFARTKHKTLAYYVIYTVAFWALLGVVFITFPRFNKTLLWKADTVSQYYPRAVFFIDYIRELFANFMQGNFTLPMYDFRMGLGGEITYSLEPVYFLFALFGREHTEFTFSFLILLRFYLAGITSSIFFRYFKKDYLTTFLASIVYVFCGFSLFGGARHPMFMVPMILLPLLILAIEEIIRGKRWYLCTIFVALSLFSNYYYLYMSTIGMGIYFLVRFFCQKEKEKRTFGNFMKKGLTISGSYLLGVAMSCIVLVTTFGLYVGSGRTGAAVIKTPSLFYYKDRWLIDCFLDFITTANSPGEWLKLGFLPISLIAVTFLFVRKGRRELKWLSVISLVLMALPLSGFVFNGFSSVSNRWCYLIALLVAYIVADCLPDMRRMTRKDIAVCAVVVAVYGYLAFFGNYMSTRYTKLAFVCLAVSFCVVLACHDSVKKWTAHTKQFLMIVLTFVMVFHSGHSLYSMAGVVREYMAPGETQKIAGDTPLLAVGEVGDDSFYRSATPKLDYWTISSSIMYDYNSTTMFNSTLNGSIMEYLERMGSTGYSMTQLFGLSNRTFLNALAAVKYYAYYEEPERTLPYGYEERMRTQVNGKETVVCENQYALPIGYTYRDSISESELEAYGVLERQEVEMQQVMLSDEDDAAWKERAGENEREAAVTLEPLEISSVEGEYLTISEHAMTADRKGEEDAPLAATLSFESLPNSETYLVLEDAVLKGDMSELEINLGFATENNKLSYKFRPDDDRYGTGQEDYVFNLGYHEEPITSCRITMSRPGTIDFGAMKLYAQPMDGMASYTEKLTEDVLENVKIETNTVSGTIELEEEKLLVLSIPYQNGWKAYVDGEETKLLRANDMYMALPLSEGEHTVRLEFAIPGVKYALVIMPSAVVLFIVLCAAGSIRRKMSVKKQKKTSES